MVGAGIRAGLYLPVCLVFFIFIYFYFYGFQAILGITIISIQYGRAEGEEEGWERGTKFQAVIAGGGKSSGINCQNGHYHH